METNNPQHCEYWQNGLEHNHGKSCFETALQQDADHHLPSNPTNMAFFSTISDMGKAMATKLQTTPVDWFKFNTDHLQPVLDKVIALLLELRDSNNLTPSYTKTKLTLDNKICNIAVREEKLDFQ